MVRYPPKVYYTLISELRQAGYSPYGVHAATGTWYIHVARKGEPELGVLRFGHHKSANFRKECIIWDWRREDDLEQILIAVRCVEVERSA